MLGPYAYQQWVRDGGFDSEIKYQVPEIMPQTQKKFKSSLRPPTVYVESQACGRWFCLQENDTLLGLPLCFVIFGPPTSILSRRLAALFLFPVEEISFLVSCHSLSHLKHTHICVEFI